jgi:hypothetical protein
VGKHRTKIRLLAVITAATLVTSISAAGAQATSYQGSSRSAQATATTSSLAPCTTPLYGPDKDCESTSLVVDRWVTFQPGAQSCTYTQFVDWGDGTSSSHTFTNPIPDQYLIASHAYRPETQTTTYTETVTSSVDSGTCEPIATTVFHFTHLVSGVAPSLDRQSLEGLGISKACTGSLLADIAKSPAEKAVVALLGLFEVKLAKSPTVGVVFFLLDAFLVIDLVHSCVEQNTELSVLPSAFAYGASHPGKPFKPSGKVAPRPQITGIYGYQKGSLVYFSLNYADPGHDAKGFGFVGINGAGWKEENHPFSSPSYGIVGKDRIDYPFNLECGTAHQYKSYVEAWIYDSQGIRSNPVEVALTCTT